MGVLSIFRKIFPGSITGTATDEEPGTAYDLWSAEYDDQPDNLMLALDAEIFYDLFQMVPSPDQVIADIGCGTGRHWKTILRNQPRSLTGFDASDGMLQMLKKKFPAAITFKSNENILPQVQTASVDLVISTLTIAHIENIDE